jgi:hypothetical protein
MMLPMDTGHPERFEIGFTPSLKPRLPALADDISGLEPGREWAEMAADIWLETSGACLLEMLTRRGEFADHLDIGNPAGIPRWHTIASGILAYGPDVDDAGRTALQQAMAEHKVLNRLSDILIPLLTNPVHNSIKVLCAQGPDSLVAEVRVNGIPHATASQALASLDWPEVKQPAVARCYAVAFPD